MYKRPAIINNYRSSLYDEPVRGLRNLIAYPDNTGNILFLETIGNQIQNCTPINIYYDFLERPEWFMQNFDVLVLPMANMVSEEWSYGEILDMLETYPIPIVLVSIGLQVDDEYALRTMKMSRDCKRLLDLAQTRSQSIGVRGYKTAEYLRKQGYSVDVIGCPSLFGPAAPLRSLKNPSRIATHCTPHGTWRQSIRNFFEFSWKYAQGYVAQNELCLLVDRYDVTDEELETWIHDPNRLKVAKARTFEYTYYADTNPTPDELRTWFRRNLNYFVDIDAWKAYLAKFDFVVGTRFHGSVVATLAGTPSLLLTTDLRVLELAEYHQLPHIPLTDIHEDTMPEELIEHVTYDRYNAVNAEAKQHYKSFLLHNGLTPSDY
jgi:hypothetical protein